ncbi:MAG: dicarboxylate transporter, subunit DctM, partial [Pseudomonadota bacterium]
MSSQQTESTTTNVINQPSKNFGWMTPLEMISAALVAGIVILLFTGVVSRYVFTKPIDWIDETVSMGFIWVGMIGAAIAMHRNEHLKLTTFVDRMPLQIRNYVQAFGLVAVVAFLLGMISPAFDYAKDEWIIAMPALQIPNTFRVAAIATGIVLMLLVVLIHALRTVQKKHLAVAAIVVGVFAMACYLAAPQLTKLGNTNLLIFLVILVAVLLVSGVPIAFCFGLGVLSYLVFTTDIPLQIVVSRMDEGMSNLVLVSVPVFVLLGCVLDSTGMGKAIIDVLASLIGHIKAGMSYVLLGSLFIVSGISGSKVSDMATV